MSKKAQYILFVISLVIYLIFYVLVIIYSFDSTWTASSRGVIHWPTAIMGMFLTFGVPVGFYAWFCNIVDSTESKDFKGLGYTGKSTPKSRMIFLGIALIIVIFILVKTLISG